MGIIERLWHSFVAWGWGWGGLAGVIGICLLALWFFTPSWLSSQPAKALLLNVALGCIAFAFLSAYFIQQGYKSCVALIESRDAAAITRANEAVKEIEVCRDGGGHWNVIDGTCAKASQ